MVNELEVKDFVGPFNIGRQEKISIKNLALLVRELIDPSMELKVDEQLEASIMCQWCDCTAIKKEIGWEAKVTLEEGIKKII